MVTSTGEFSLESCVVESVPSIVSEQLHWFESRVATFVCSGDAYSVQGQLLPA